MIRVRTLGQCSIHINDLRIGPDAEILFATLLLLTIERGRHVGRSELLGMLWPEAPASRAAHCLRQTIYRLRTLGVPLEVDGTDVVIVASCVDCDADALLRAQRSDDHESIAEFIAGPFLPGYAPTFSDRLRDWIDRKRDLVTFAARRVLIGAIGVRKSRGEWPEVERLAHCCLSFDPLNEDATLALAETAALNGAKTEAISILDRYLREMGPTARELRRPALMLRRRIFEPRSDLRVPPPANVPFVGRTREMGALRTALCNARAGRGGVCFIHGEPGIGKTRLLTEFTRAAVLEDVRIASTLSQPSDSRRPLSAFVDLAPKLMALPGALGCSPGSHAYLRRLIQRYSSDAPPTPETAEAVLLYANVRRSLFDLFDAIAAESLLVVTIEDAHWLDPASWEMLAEATDWIRTRCMILVVTSRESWPRSSTNQITPEGPHTLWLGPIDTDARQRLVDCAVPRGTPDAFRDWCADMSGGNPFYLYELAVQGLTQGGQYRVPPTLVSLVNERIERLSPHSCRLLQVCSVLGKHSTLERVEAVLGEARTAMLDALDELESKGLVQWDGTCIRSKHELLSQAALGRASDLCRRTLHFHAARCFEETFHVDASASTAWNAAEHWLAAGEPSRAINQLRNCASQALELGRPTEACTTLQTCLTIPMSSLERIDLQRQLLRALRIADRNADAIAILEEVVRAQNSEPNLSAHTDEEIELIMAKWAIGDDLPSLLAAFEACALCRSASVRHRLRAARYAFMLADNMCASHAAHRIYTAVREDLASQTALDAERWYCEMVYHIAFGDVSIAVIVARLLLASRRRLGDTRDSELVCVHVADVLCIGGELAEGTAIYEQAYASSLEAKLIWIACLSARRLAWQHLDAGRLREAGHWADLAVAHSARIQHSGSVADALAAAAEVALADGRLEGAADLIRQSDAAWGLSRHARADAHGLALRCTLWLAEGKPEKCRSVIDQLDAAHSETCRHAGQDLLTARCARVHEALGDLEGARLAVRRFLPNRRDRGPLSVELQTIVERLGLETTGLDVGSVLGACHFAGARSDSGNTSPETGSGIALGRREKERESRAP